MKTNIYLVLSSILYTQAIYAHNANFDADSGALHIPAVEVSSNGTQTGIYDVQMQRVPDATGLGFVFALGAYSDAKTMLNKIKEKGTVRCGGRSDLPGFGITCLDGSHCGFDIDLCRAVAAAVFNSVGAPITFVPVSTADREKSLTDPSYPIVDILSRNLTWTSSREANWGNFAWIMFYDGQGFMVRKDSGITTLQQLHGQTICVALNTTTYDNLNDTFKGYNLTFVPIESSDTSIAITDYEQGKCVAFTSDKSGLGAFRKSLANPDAHVIMDVTISKEPLTPAVPNGDDQWLDIVRTVMWGLINAEELGITKANIDEKINGGSPEVKRLLGVEGDFGQQRLGLEPTAIAQAIRTVGNYGEIYDRYLGPDGLDIPRGPNKLWTNGGQIYAPPLR
jgi:general L-amino acid transport system substrate-binding protein